MKSVGVIRIEAKFSVGNPGVLCAEREDGKGNQDFLFTNTGKVFVAEIPYSEQNIELAKSFWKKRGFTVTCKFQELVDPFPPTELALWAEKESMEMEKERKSLKTLEAESKKLVAKLPELEAIFQEEFQKYVAARELAETRRQEQPPKPESLEKAGKVLEDATKRIDEIAQMCRTIESGLL